MRWYGFVLYVFLLLVVACKGDKQKPFIQVSMPLVEMGSVKFDSLYKISYEIVNKGTADLIIDTATASCDCTVPFIQKKRIPPGDTAQLLVEYKPADTGYFDKKLVIKSNTDSIFTVVSFRGRAIK